MGIIWDLIRWGVKTAANKVRWIFTQKPTTVTPQKTLNEEIETNTQMPTSQVGSFSGALNNQINIQNWANVWVWSDVWNNLVIGGEPQGEIDWFSTAPDAIWLWERLWDWAATASTRYDANQRAEHEAKSNEKSFIVDANLTGNTVTKVSPKDEWAFYEQLNLFNSEYDSAATPEEKQRAWDTFKNDVNELGFKAESFPNTKYGRTLRAWWKRYTDEELSSVVGNNIPLWDYKMTDEELADYINMLSDNNEIRKDSYNKYQGLINIWLDDEDSAEAESANEFVQNFSDIAKKDTLDLINRNVASAKRWDAVRNVNDIVTDPANRLLTSEMYLKRLRDEAAQTPELQRTQWQRDMIYNYDVVWKQLKDQYASNVNDYLMLQLTEWVDDKWEISDALRRFEDWERLNNILRKNLWEIAGIDVSWSRKWWRAGETFWKVSALDIMRRFANETAYKYKQGKLAQNDYTFWDRAKSAWNEVEHWQEPIWEQRAEAWQTVWRLGTKLVNTVGSVFQWRWWWNAPAAAWWDADFSVFKLIETDDSPSKRTVKKYGLQFWEYIPEWLWAAAPDILLTYATAGWSVPSLLKSVGTFSKNVQRFTRVKKLLDETSKTAKVVGGTLKWLDRVWEIWRNLWNINSWEKRVLNIADRTLSQFAVWQSMDAKLSAFDTEPYSDTSFWLSMWGSLLWDILPEAKDIWGIMRTWARGWKAWTKGTWVWDLVDFISQSDENARLIAQQMWKRFPEFSEQDLKNYVRAYAAITDAAKNVFENLTPEQKGLASEWTKELMYNYVKQAYLPNSRIWKAVREIVKNKATNPADIIKYIWWIPWTVSIGPYQSRIKLKQGTLAWVQSKNGGWYDTALDSIDWWFGNKVSRGFTFKDIQDISKIKWYEDVLKNRDKYFRKVTEKVKRWGKDGTQTRRILSEDGLDKFWLEAKNLTLASLWIEISWAEDVKQIFKEKMKDLEGMNLSKDTIEALAENWGYTEVVSKIENILC